MKALRIEQHGSIDELKAKDLPRPVPGMDEILVQVFASGVNRSDVLSAQGSFLHSALPRTLGRDFAGQVVEGPPELMGSRVWGSGGDLGITRDGTHAEFVVLPRAAVAPCPRNLSFEQAATAGVPFITAWAALMELGQLKAGDWVIISGGGRGGWRRGHPDRFSGGRAGAGAGPERGRSHAVGPAESSGRRGG